MFIEASTILTHQRLVTELSLNIGDMKYYSCYQDEYNTKVFQMQ